MQELGTLAESMDPANAVPPGAPQHRFAYVTLVMRGDRYVCGALTLGHSIRTHCRRVGTDIDLIVLVTDDVSSSAKQTLGLVYTHVLQVPYIKFKARQRHAKRFEHMYDHWLSDSFTKIQVVGSSLRAYEKVVLLDADMICESSADAIFTVQAPAGICATIPNREQNAMHGQLIIHDVLQRAIQRDYGIRGCCVLLEPSMEDFNGMLRLLQSNDGYGEDNLTIGPDEKLFSDYYARKGWRHLHSRFGCTSWKVQELEAASDCPVAFMHFVSEKPWLAASMWDDFKFWDAHAVDFLKRNDSGDVAAFFPQRIIDAVNEQLEKEFSSPEAEARRYVRVQEQSYYVEGVDYVLERIRFRLDTLMETVQMCETRLSPEPFADPQFFNFIRDSVNRILHCLGSKIVAQIPISLRSELSRHLQRRIQEGLEGRTTSSCTVLESRLWNKIATQMEKINKMLKQEIEQRFARLFSPFQKGNLAFGSAKSPAQNAVLRDIRMCILEAYMDGFVDGHGSISMKASDFNFLKAHGFEDEHVRLVFRNMLMKGRLTFPWKRNHTLLTAAQLFRNLQAYVPRLDSEPYNMEYTDVGQRRHGLFPLTFDGVPERIISTDEDYNNMDLVVDLYQEQERLTAKRKSGSRERPSVMEKWADASCALELIKNAMQSAGGNLSSRIIREQIYNDKDWTECTQFKPTLAFAVYRRLGGTRILDFSAGWGDRLCAAIAAGVEKYVGVDPNVALEKGHREIIRCNATAEDRRSKRFQVIYEPFQTCTLPDGLDFDLIFTSPPFFDLEIYTTLETQSVRQHSKYADWVIRFLFKSLYKAWSVLVPNGHLAIHLGDMGNYRLCEVMCLFCEYALENAVYRGIIASVGAAKEPRPIFVWRKVVESDTEDADAPDAKKRDTKSKDRMSHIEKEFRNSQHREIFTRVCNGEYKL